MEDAQIVELYWQRSDTAIEETAAKFGRYCLKIAANVLADRLDAEECVNDTWLAAWNSMPDNRPAALAPYLGKITRNFALDRLAQRRRQKRGGGAADLALSELEECLAGQGSPERAVEDREIAECIDAFLRTLPRMERAVFVARYWYMAPTEEIARRFDFTPGKVSGMLFRTRKKLRKALIKEGLI